MFRRTKPEKIGACSRFDDDLRYTDKLWALTVVYDNESKNTELVLEGVKGNNFFTKTFFLDTQHGAQISHYLADGTHHDKDVDSDSKTYTKSFHVDPDKALQLLAKVAKLAEVKVNRYTKAFNESNPVEASYRWARAQLLSVLKFASLPTNSVDFRATVEKEREHTFKPGR